MQSYSESVSIDGIFDEVQLLREQNNRLQEHLDRIFGISSAVIYILDPEGCFTFVNRAVEEILNFTPEELIGKHFSIILPPEEYERVSRKIALPKILGHITGADNAPKLFDERRSGDRRTKNMEVKLLTRKRDDFRILVGDVTGIVEVEGAYSLEDGTNDDSGKEVFLGSQGVIFDITKYKKAEAERLELHRRLFQLQKMDAIGKLAGKVAHDLNNKLGSIIGTAEILKQDLNTINPDILAAYLDTILSASRHATELSNRLSEFSRRGDTGYATFNFHEMLEKVMEFVRSIVSDSVSINKILLSKNPVILGSQTLLQSALLNLVVNAFEAMRKGGGVLTIETGDVAVESMHKSTFPSSVRPGEYLLVSVQDTGVGMGDYVKSRLFEPFFTTNSDSGLGLGMLSIRECIRNHGGVINVQSDPGKGSRFDIYLPRV
ncbi:MAG: PAS domain S-box protein [Chitinispirillales bacterium]|jgi:PAS domain S-box-containing protein|nr:PAS domain S-box protein [Chitinispirillales bacterium]